MLQAIRFSNAVLARAITISSYISMATKVFGAPAQTSNAFVVAQIRSVLRAQQDAWNRGDIDGFINGYARSPSTVFISDDTIRRGWQTVRDRYRQKYSNMARPKDRPHGRFTLIFRRLPEGWRTVHDHTSAAPP